MSKLYTEKDIKQMLDQGQCLSSLPADAKFSPMARDLLRQQKIRPSTKPVAASIRVFETWNRLTGPLYP